ncbi:MAG: nucleotidyltransferase domain-containing protein [Ignavibacteriaceae bacterium]
MNENDSDILKQYYPVEKIILFGSFSRNEQRQNSDIDVAVVLIEIKDDYLELNAKLFSLGYQIDSRIEPVFFEEGVDPSGFLDEINRTGITVYQKS